MKRPTKQLADDLLEDSMPPEFRTVLLDKALQSARRRKHLRRARWAGGVIAVMGILTMVGHLASRQTASLRVQKSGEVKVAKAVATPPVVISEFKPPREINDDELLALAGDKPVALILRGAHQSELVFLDTREK